MCRLFNLICFLHVSCKNITNQLAHKQGVFSSLFSRDQWEIPPLVLWAPQLAKQTWETGKPFCISSHYVAMNICASVFVCYHLSNQEQESDSHTGSSALLISTYLKGLTRSSFQQWTLSSFRHDEVNDFMWLLFVWFQSTKLYIKKQMLMLCVC